MAKTNVRGGQIADGANGVSLTVDVTGTLPVANGGTGLTAAGTAGNIPISDGTGWVSTPNGYDTEFDYDQGRALRVFRGAYLGGSSSPADIHILGASHEEGYGTTLMTNGWPYVFRDVLRAFAQPKGLAGGGSIPASNSTYQAGVGNYFGFNAYAMYTGGVDAQYPDSPMSGITGSFTAATQFGLGLRGIVALTNGATFTLEWYGTSADLIYPTSTLFGAFTYSVDGGTPVAVSEAVATSVTRIQTGALARGRHTMAIVVTSLGTGGAVAWSGATFYDGDEASGIRLWSAPRSGYGAKDYVSGTGQTAWTNDIMSWNLPDLYVISLGFNDWNLGGTSAQFKTDMLSIIAQVKARCNTISAGWVPSIVIMSMFATTPSAGTLAIEPWSNFLTKMKEIAAADDEVALFDIQKWFGRPSETAASTRGGILIPDGVHLSNGGSAIIGGALAEFVLGSSERMRDLVRFGTKAADPTYNAAITNQTGFAADTYLTGSNVGIPTGRLKAGTMYRCKLKVTKTGAGTATPIVQVRLGTAGTTADTSRATLTFAAQTAVADDGFIEVFVTFRAVGASTGVIHASGVLDHSLAATGFSTANTSIKEATSSTFDTTTPTTIGLSVNGGTSAAWTISMVQAELQNAA